jgi:DNA-binding SARP family transcriptional activator
MQLGILGPIQANCAGISCVPSAVKSRKVLALLLVNADSVVSLTAIKQELWDQDAPRSASTTLQTYILQLRKLLDAALPSGSPSPKDILATRPGGYVFHIGSGSLDLHQYEALMAGGQASMDSADWGAAAERFRRALDLWRGPSLEDIEHGRQLETHVIKLNESRLYAMEQLIEAEMLLGRHHAIIAQLAALVTEHRLNEDLRAQFMLALYRCGRRAQALETFRNLRDQLVGEIGVEPSTKLTRLHQAILTSDPRLDELHNTKTVTGSWPVASVS